MQSTFGPFREVTGRYWLSVANFAVRKYTGSMRIPHTQLSPAALRAVVEEFVTRDGTDHSPVEGCIQTVLLQLDAGRVELHFDGKTETCTILPVEEKHLRK